MKVKFLTDVTYETEGPGKGPQFKTGEVYDFDDAFAQRWVRRGVAELTETEAQFKPITRVVAKADDADEGKKAPEPEAKPKADPLKTTDLVKKP